MKNLPLKLPVVPSSRILFAISAVSLLCIFAPRAGVAANDTWNNTGTDMNTAASWSSAASLGLQTGDTAVFNVVAGTQPNLSASLSIAELNFSTAASSGYTLTSSNGTVVLTLTGATVINGANTGSTTNTISAPINLGGAAGTVQISTQVAGGTLIINGPLTNTNSGTFSIAGTGTTQLNGANAAFTDNITENATNFAIGNNSALGSGTFIMNGGTFSSDNGSMTLSNNVLLTNSESIGGSGAFTFNGNYTNSGGNSNLGINDTGGVTLAGNIYLSDSSSVARTLTISGTQNLIITGSIANFNGVSGTTAGLTINGNAGQLVTFSNGNSNYNGTTLLEGSGTIALNASETMSGNLVLNGPVGTGSLSLSNNAGIEVLAGGNGNIDNVTALVGSSTIIGSIAITFNNFGGSFTNSGGNRTLAVNDTGGVTLAGPIYLSEVTASSRTLIIGGSFTTTISGSIANFNGGPGTPSELENNGSVAGQELILSNGNSTFSGTMDIQGSGTLAINAAETVVGGLVTMGPIGTGTFNLNGSNLIALGGARMVDNTTMLAASTTIAGLNAITFNSQGGSFTVKSAGTRTLTVNNTATTTLAGNVYLSDNVAASGTLTVAGSGSTVISGSIADVNGSGLPGGVTVNGGNLTISNPNNTYSGVTSITNSGILGVGGDNVLGTGTLTWATGTLLSSGGPHTIGNTINFVNANNYTIAGSNNLTLSGSLLWNGSQTLTVNNTAQTTINGTVSLRNDATIAVRTMTISGSGNTVINGAIVNGSTLNGILDYTGSGTLVLAGNNTYTGNTVIGVASGTAASTVQLGSSSGLGFGGVQGFGINPVTTVNGGATLDLKGQTGVNEAIALTGSTGGGNSSLINSNTGTAAVLGGGIAYLAVSNSGSNYTSAPTVTIGPSSGVTATGSTSLGLTAGSFTINPGTTTYSAAPTVTITGGGATGAATATAVLTGGTVSGINITSTGFGYTSAPTITFTGGTVLVPGTNPTGTGNATDFSVGGIAMTTAGTLYSSASVPTVTFSGGGGAAATPVFSSVALSATSATLPSANYNMGGDGNLTVNAVISGGAGTTLTKTGTGNLILNAANTYTAATIINSGSLVVNGSIASSGSVMVNAGGALSGFGSVGLITGAGKIAPADGPNIMTAAQIDPVSNGATSFSFVFTQLAPNYANANGSGNDVLHLTGATPLVSNLTGANVITVDFSGATLADGQVYLGGFFTDSGTSSVGSPTFNYTGITGFNVAYEGMVSVASAAFGTGTVTNGSEMEFQVTAAVPEPGTYAMVLSGFGLLIGVQRLRKRRR